MIPFYTSWLKRTGYEPFDITGSKTYRKGNYGLITELSQKNDHILWSYHLPFLSSMQLYPLIGILRI